MPAATATTEPAHKVTTMVRADSRSGHLVRAVKMSSKVVEARTIAADAAIPESTMPATGPNATLVELVEQASQTYGVDAALIHSIIKVESNFNPNAVSNKGAQGLMQLIPSTAKRLGVKNSLNPKENIDGGVRYYKYLQSLFGDDRLALAAYNAGEGAVAKYNFKVPPYPETVNYVYQVGRNWGEVARRRRSQPAKVPVATGSVVAENVTPQVRVEVHPKLEQFRDPDGKVYIRTIKQ